MKRWIAGILAVALTASLFAGCGSQEPEQTYTEPQTQVTATAPAAQTPAQQETVQETQPLYVEEPAQLRITEVMPDNRNYTYGTDLDWVELYNPGDAAAELDGYYLTDDVNDLQKLSLAGCVIGSGNYLVVVLEEAAPLQLSEIGETVYLTCNGQVIAELTYEADGSCGSYDGQNCCEFPTPGYANTEAGYLAYLEEAELPALSIHEVMVSNSQYPDEQWMLYDMIEIKNNSNREIDLSGYSLTKGWEGKNRYDFPAVTLKSGEFYVIYCSGDSAKGADHAPFKLSSEGQTLCLFQKGEYVDALVVPAGLEQDESYGRCGNVPMYLQTPTFGAENSEGYLRGIRAPEADVAPGMYDEAVTLTLSGEGVIYYTLNGSEPTTRSAVYREPITVDDVTTVRAISSNNGRISSVSNFTYVIGKEHDLPVLVISMPAAQRSLMMSRVESSMEYEAVMTLIEDGEVKFTVPFGMRLHGNDSRKGSKKNFQLRFRGEYGAGKLQYRLFEDRDIDEFDSLVLKGGSEDWSKAVMRDEVSTYMVNGTTALYTQAMKPVVLYLGGEYWGVHYIRERFSDEYVASHMDVSAESADILFSTNGYVQVGSNKDFTALKNFVQKNDMTKMENYQYLVERIDVNGLMDWYICRSYLGDTDQANIRRLRSTEGDGLWHWAFFDLDWSFYTSSTMPIKKALDEPNGEPVLIAGLLKSEMGRDAFLKRYAYLMSTILNEEYIDQCIYYVESQIRSEMPRDRERWDKSMAAWEYYLQELYNFVEDGARDRLILTDLQNYFELTDEEMEYYFSQQLEKLEKTE